MKPSCNGAPAGAITIGIVRVAPIAARIAGVKWATMIRRWSGRRSAGIREKDLGPAARALRRVGPRRGLPAGPRHRFRGISTLVLGWSDWTTGLGIRRGRDGNKNQAGPVLASANLVVRGRARVARSHQSPNTTSTIELFADIRSKPSRSGVLRRSAAAGLAGSSGERNQARLAAYHLYGCLRQERPMQIGVVLQGGGKPIQTGRAPRPVRSSLHRPAARQFSTGGGRADFPLRKGDLVSVDHVERLGQLALCSGQVPLGERGFGERLAPERQVRPLARRRRDSTQLL